MVISDSQNRRKNYFIKKEFQVKFILKFCILVVIAALISAFVIYYFSSQSVSTVFENSRLTIKPGTEFILPGLILSSLISIAIVGVATVFIVLFVSHRIAGPLYKLENSLERMASGDLSFDIHFRNKDEIARLARNFNAASHNLNRLMGEIKTEATQIDSAINELKVAIGTLPEEKHLKEIIEKIDIANKHLNEELNKFRLR